MFTTITDAKTYYQNSGRYNMETPKNFDENLLIQDLFHNAGEVEEAEQILAKHIPD